MTGINLTALLVLLNLLHLLLLLQVLMLLHLLLSLRTHLLLDVHVVFRTGSFLLGLSNYQSALVLCTVCVIMLGCQISLVNLTSMVLALVVALRKGVDDDVLDVVIDGQVDGWLLHLHFFLHSTHV